MQLGMIGLGRMGNGMTERLREHGHDVKTYDPAVESRTAASLAELKSQLDAPRAFWMMIPAGKITEDTFQELLSLADAGDTIVDGGNSNFRDSQRRYAAAQEKGIHFVDAGISRRHLGPEGRLLHDGRRRRRAGAAAGAGLHCARAAGRLRARRRVRRGHFTKMVHNGIEYGLMQSYAEGFEIMEHSEFGLDLHEIAGIWRYGSVVRSWLLELLYDAFEKHGAKLDDIAAYVEDSGEGRWTIFEAIAENVPAPVISASLFARFASRDELNFAAKVSAALRNEFGGHAVKAAD